MVCREPIFQYTYHELGLVAKQYYYMLYPHEKEKKLRRDEGQGQGQGHGQEGPAYVYAHTR